eukprot:comp16937_c0_seq1/m.15520 comp16937_c0_seq1/g.15520  ORF comp16937_c0_seq1/g.15520 comp16937_c0_seq1/m.15520 type:complete len:346 (-) comp16937_c0_seq1:426-1463(-)
MAETDTDPLWRPTSSSPGGNYVSPSANYGSANQQNRVAVDQFIRTDSMPVRRATTFMGPIRNPDQWGKLFMTFFSAEAIAVVGLCAYRLYKSIPITDATRSDFVYTVCLLLNIPFCLYYCIHGTLRERHVELYAFVCATLLVTAYVFYQYFTEQHEGMSDPTSRSHLVRLAVVCVCEPVNLVLALAVANRFGWVSFMTVGGDSVLAGMWHTYCVFFSLLKVNLQTALTFILISFFSQGQTFPFEWVVETCVLFFLLLSFGLASYVFPGERSSCLFPFMAVMLVQPGYIVWKVLQASVFFPDSYTLFVRLPIFVVGGVSFLLYMLTVIYGIIVWRNFGSGLYERLH